MPTLGERLIGLFKKREPDSRFKELYDDASLDCQCMVADRWEDGYETAMCRAEELYKHGYQKECDQENAAAEIIFEWGRRNGRKEPANELEAKALVGWRRELAELWEDTWRKAYVMAEDAKRRGDKAEADRQFARFKAVYDGFPA